ncbi:MAG: hypothetical protein HC902_00615 [Calothrix sp. SM1_5_4]|nr:hypothetical protein [Calothrix sp. SM1_5_4]
MEQNSQDIKIRVLPRPGEPGGKPPLSRQGASGPKAGADKREGLRPPIRWIIYVGSGSLALILSVVLGSRIGKPSSAKIAARAAPIAGQQIGSDQADLASMQDRVSASITRHMQESTLKEELLRRERQIANERVPVRDLDEVPVMPEQDPSRIYGLQFDQEDSADQVYRDLQNDNSPAENLPSDRINARLANRKWVNEVERAERIQFVRNFIRAAYERGYEVELDQNLVVVRVKKIDGVRKINIEQVIDKMAKQGF